MNRLSIRTIGSIFFLANGCATSSVTAFRDPNYQEAVFQNIAVISFGMTFEGASKMERGVCSKIAPVPCIGGKDIFPPTREYSNEEIATTLKNRNFDAVLAIILTEDESATAYVGTITSATGAASTTASASGSGNFATVNANTQFAGSAVSTPMYETTRMAFGELALIDLTKGAIAWRGQIKTSGKGGFLSTSDSAFLLSATGEISSQIKQSGLFIINEEND